MPVKTIRTSTNPIGSPEWTDSTTEQRETTVDGTTFAWGVNETRNFADDGVGIKHAAFGQGLASVIQENVIPFQTSKS